MKRLLKAAIVALVLSPSLVLASHYKTERINVREMAAGTYYKGYAWIFYAGRYIGYEWYHLEDDGSIKQKGGNCYIGCGYTGVQPACCVFQDKIYLFWREDSENKMYYAVFDGSHWSGKTKLGSSIGSPFGMAVAVMGGKLYLFYQGQDYIRFRYTSDGKNWSAGDYVSTYLPHRGQYKTDGNIAAATYFADLGDGSKYQLIRLAWPTSDNKQIRNGKFDKYGNFHSSDADLLSQYAEGVALVEGSVDGAGTGKEAVQIFALGKRDPYKEYPYLRCEYRNDEHGGSFSGWETVGHFTAGYHQWSDKLIPSAVTNYKVFGDNAHNLRQEVWMVYPGHCIRWNSDQYVRVQDTSQQLYKDAYKKYWTLIGVVEGPPPYALNGRDPTSDDVQGYSELSYAVEADTAVSSTTTTSAEFFVSASGPGKFWPGVAVSYTQGMEDKFCTRQVHSEKLTHTFYPTTDTTRFLVYRYYLRPTMRRLKYETRDWKGNSLGRYAYIFSISDYNLHVDAINMRDSLPYDPRIWDPATYQDRHIAADISHYHIKAGRMINWVEGTKVELEISDEKGIESSQSFTQTIEIDVTGIAGIFDIGVKGSISSEHTVSTDSINTVTVMAHSPDPRGGHPEDIKSFSFYPYCLEPKDSTPYWIPKEFKHQRPWCITYEVTEIEYTEAVATGLAEEKSLPSLKLYAISPTPSGLEVTIRYELPEEMKISLKVYDVNGRLVKVLTDKEQNSGIHSIYWNGRDEKDRKLPNGVYFCRLKSGNEHRISRIVLIQ